MNILNVNEVLMGFVMPAFGEDWELIPPELQSVILEQAKGFFEGTSPAYFKDYIERNWDVVNEVKIAREEVIKENLQKGLEE